MKNFNLLLIVIVFFNYCFLNVLAENNYYIVSISADKNDKNYDLKSEQDQYAFDEFVNDRMNDIYNIILENKDTYVLKNGTIDEKVNEISRNLDLKNSGNKKSKFLFIDNNRPEKKFNQKYLKGQNNTNEDIKYIPIDSDLVSPICPVSNYYAIRVYLSDVTLKKIEKIPNIIGHEILATDSAKYGISTTNKNIKETVAENNNKFYNTKEILDETHWNAVEVQEIPFKYNYDVYISHLSVISQGQYSFEENTYYDNNYYYPSSAGKGVDIYVVDSGLNTSLYPNEFNTYEGTPDERTISCDGNIYDGKFHFVNATEKYDCTTHEKGVDNLHGTIVSIAAAGTISGSAKKANIHVLAVYQDSASTLVAMDYIRNHGTPYKTVINFSFGLLPFSQVVQDKLNDMVKEGFIFTLAAGNRDTNVCTTIEDFAIYDGFIVVGSFNINDSFDMNMNDISYDIHKSSYSDYGECLDIFAPGTLFIYNISKGDFDEVLGTSFSSPLVAGVASTIISEHPEIQYDYKKMKQTLIDLSLKDVIENLKDSTPNRLLNNGKHTVYHPLRCDNPSNKDGCSKDGCCSVHGFCVDPNTTDSNLRSLCYLGENCQSEFGQCYDGDCNHKNSINKCGDKECCSSEGNCVRRDDDYYNECFIENGCISEFSGHCLSSELKDLKKYNEKDQQIILIYNCEKELKSYEICNCMEKSPFEDQDYKEYIEKNCDEFLNSPFNFAPSCKKLSDESKESIEFFRNLELIKGYCKIATAKEDPSSSDKRCEISKSGNDYMDLSLIKKSCPFNECREAMISYFNAQYKKYFYRPKKLNKYKTLIEFISGKCLQSELEEEIIEFTTYDDSADFVDENEDHTEFVDEYL